MKPRSTQSSNDHNHRMISDDEIAVAKNRFQANISNGIAVLVKHGYSRARAVALILDQIRQTEAPPSDNEVSLSIWKLFQ